MKSNITKMHGKQHIKKNSVSGMPLIHATAGSGNLELLQILMRKENVNLSLKDHNEHIALHWLIQIGDWKPGDKKSLKNC